MAGYREHWERVVERLNPLNPAGQLGAPMVEETKRVERPYSPLQKLQRDLQRPARDFRRELIYGSPGSGKTTELFALLNNLQESHLLLYLDIYAYFEHRGDALAMNRLYPWEVIAVLGLALYRFGEEHLGRHWTTEETRSFQEAISAFQAKDTSATLNVGAMAKDVSLVAVGALGDAIAPGAQVFVRTLLAAVGQVSKAIPLGTTRGNPLEEQDNRVQKLKEATFGLVRSIKAAASKPLVLVIDGIDRGDKELIERLLWESQLIAELPCHVVMCAPVPSRVRIFAAHRLSNPPVMDQTHPEQYGTGVNFMLEVWKSRAQNLPAGAVDPAYIQRLGWASGGLMREFLQMVRGVVDLAWDEDGPVRAVHVEEVVEEWRKRWEEGIGTTRREALKKVQQARCHDDSELDLSLIEERRIVVFPNDSTWYYPHPLLTLKMLPPPSAA